MSGQPYLILLEGCFTRAELTTRWAAAAGMRANDTTRDLIETIWTELGGEARRRGEPFPSRHLCRLVDWRVGAGGVQITFGPTEYREMMGTNQHHPDIGGQFGRDYLSNATGACTVVATADGKLAIQRRSASVLQFPGWYHVCGGMLEPTGWGENAAVDPFTCLETELFEELAIDRSAIAELRCLGLVEDRRTCQPELVFDAVVRLDAERIGRVRGPEHNAIVVLDDSPTELAAFIADHGGRMVPVGLACLVLYGQRRYGPAWRDQVAPASSR